MSVSSLALVGLLQEINVVLGLPLNVAPIIFGCIFSMLFSNFRVRELRSIPLTTMTALTEVSIHCLYRCILFLLHCDSVCVLLCIQCLEYALSQTLSAQEFLFGFEFEF